MRKRIVIAVVSVFLAVVLLLCIVPSIAKYITSRGQQNEIYSENFYFTSDYLKANETPVYEIYGSAVTFKIRNYADSLRINDTDIVYNVTADGGVIKLPNGTLTGTLTGAVSSSSDITLSYNFQNGELQKEITVSVSAMGAYTQTLKARFIFIKPTDTLKYYIEDSVGRNYAQLYICSAVTAKTATLYWNTDKLLIDETNDYVFNNVVNNTPPTNSSATTQDIIPGTTAKIVFLKKDLNADYTCDITETERGNINIPKN